MPPRDKAKASGVNASSFFDLKADLAKKEDEIAKSRAAGKATVIVGGVKRGDKKLSQWAKANRGVHDRAARDVELEAVSKQTIDDAYAKLERKSKAYSKLRKGKHGGLDEKQYSELLYDPTGNVDNEHWKSDSDEEDESLTVPVAPQEAQDDPIIEYEDEFGRARTARMSEIPRHLLPESEREEEEDFDPFVVHNPVNHFPMYEPSAERIKTIQAQYAEENNPLNIHYDASREVRAKGAGFYQFSGDEETRRKQMEGLRQAREETERTRAEVGAEDVRPGEVEGMQADMAAGAGSSKSRAMEKRRRDREERQRLVDAKKRKVAGNGNGAEANSPPTLDNSREPPPSTRPVPSDPFAALEAQSKESKGTEGKAKTRVPALNETDAFLAKIAESIKD
ncbi:hypothetical protein C8Q78DRAFT_1078406 [Trametes maxima]|nr:hypothetical protein C8Q78DRAFT_1078406 [Trametes maxima]